MIVNEYGKIANKEWQRTEDLRDNVCLDEFVVMPNHLHGIIQLIGGRDTARRVPTKKVSRRVLSKSDSAYKKFYTNNH